jgi:hypothetical protein
LVYRLWFQSGICDEVPVANQDLTSIKRSCPFATGDSANSLSPNQKRNIMYWWYATNIFLIYGKGNCGPLPEYLVYAIWCQYPNPKGVEYVGFLNNDDSDDRETRKWNRYDL